MQEQSPCRSRQHAGAVNRNKCMHTTRAVNRCRSILQSSYIAGAVNRSKFIVQEQSNIQLQ